MNRTQHVCLAAALSIASNGFAIAQSPSSNLASISFLPSHSFARSTAPLAQPTTDRAGQGGRGSLLLCGGSVLPASIIDAFYERGRGGDGNLVIIPTASILSDQGDFARWNRMWESYSWKSCAIVHAYQRSDANQKELADRLRDATAVWIAGGDQQRLFDRYDGTTVLEELKNVFERGGIIAGTSAGAAIMSKVMIAGGLTKPKLAKGWNLLPSVIVDQHFSQRARFERLATAVELNPDQIGIGIDESTAFFLDGQKTSVVGNGSVYVKDGSKAWVRLDAESTKAFASK